MLICRAKDSSGRIVELPPPLSLTLNRSDSAPADSLKAVFVVSGDMPALCSVEVRRGTELLFEGMLDEQSEELSASGRKLTLNARSRAAVLLDNEARPQLYCCPSMPLLIKRHFAPLGFRYFRGTDRVFCGQLSVSKGMSEWAVLERFCRFLGNVRPRVDRNGVIDITGKEPEETLMPAPEAVLSVRHVRRNRVLISELRARTYLGGEYEMPFREQIAASMGIRRRRYLNLADGRGKTAEDAEEMMKKCRRAYETVITECAGCFWCETGGRLQLYGEQKGRRIKRLVYTSDEKGERTIIETEEALV